MPLLRPSITAATVAALTTAGLAAPAAADAASSRFVIRGAGFGHGVGMSQYGALGFALRGVDHRAILSHYYTGTELGRLTAAREVRVLLQSTSGLARFSGAARAGSRGLNPATTYAARGRADGTVDLLSPRGRRLARYEAPMRVSGAGAPLTFAGLGAYRGALELRPSSAGGVNVINAVDLEEYLMGVVAAESPPSWPAEALKAQAVAARTYAITTSKGGAGWEHYADTRSQVYGGVARETPSTNAAIEATRGQVVTYEGRPVVTYFFSTSGGRTEDVENAFGGAPQPWLKSVEDPYDDVSPRHRWGPLRMTLAAAGRRLGSLVQGRFRGVEVLERGRSPRIVAADVVGSRGRTRVNGATLRARFALPDSWAYFTTISARRAPGPALRGTVVGAPGRTVVVERRVGARWRGVERVRLRAGRYRAEVARAGTYRVRAGTAATGSVRVPTS